jgi:DNA polymerase-3 subunit chi
MSKENPSAIFHHVATPKEKLHRVCEIAKEIYDKGEKVFISVEDDKAAKYLDRLLWSQPPESFMPHEVSDTPSKLPVVISTQVKNLNNATVMLNLCGSVPPLTKKFSCIHELEDYTTPEKQRLTEERLKTYKDKGFLVQQGS